MIRDKVTTAVAVILDLGAVAGGIAISVVKGNLDGLPFILGGIALLLALVIVIRADSQQ